MRLARKALFLVFASGMVLAQANPPATPLASTASVSDELKQLREAVAQQQKLMLQQQQQMAQQQQQMTEQQQKIDALQKALEAKTSGAPHVENASLNTTNTSSGPITQSDVEKPKESPLSFRIGGTDFTPGGFVDFENIFRSTNTGNVSATNFWAIPFSNTVPGHLTEYRATGQYSRFNLKTSTHFKGSDVMGYIEGDFNGNDAASVFVTSNSHTMRLRLYWLDLRHGSWEFLGGSTWGLETPNRVGVSPMPADLSLTLGEDAQTHIGINYTRAAEFRAAYHFSNKFVWAVGLQNPQQFIGQQQNGTNEVAFPNAFNAQLGSQLDPATTPGAPNLAPDILTKFAYDTGTSHKFHFEAGGLATSAKVTVLPTVPNTSFTSHTKWEGGFMGATNYELFKNFRLLAQGMWGPGVGRYIIGMGPQLVIVPVPAVSGGTCTNLGGCDVHISPVHAGDVLVGAETQLGSSQFGFYYGGAYFQRNTFPDITSATQPNIGFGGIQQVGSTFQNRALQEGSIDWTQTFWKNPQYGAVLLVTQASYVTRATWFVAAGAPKNAHLTMGYVSLRYVLP
ncbi:MAG TPA: hypothetical protein VJV96_08140 [Candidatus Angelobacter sp.]|nr:hypothetical protein [Candidatus Angelobacter sp.]